MGYELGVSVWVQSQGDFFLLLVLSHLIPSCLTMTTGLTCRPLPLLSFDLISTSTSGLACPILNTNNSRTLVSQSVSSFHLAHLPTKNLPIHLISLTSTHPRIRLSHHLTTIHTYLLRTPCLPITHQYPSLLSPVSSSAQPVRLLSAGSQLVGGS